MSDDFNPYHKWLGIPPKHQPADHYRLLGVAQFESDRDVITGASDQRINFLHTLKSGEHGKRVDKLLNEIANAKACLLNKEKKAAYDQSLRSKTATTEDDLEKSSATPAFDVDAEPASQRRSTRPVKGSSKRGGTRTGNRARTRSGKRAGKKDAAETKSPRRLVPLIAIGLGGLTVIVLVILMISGGDETRDDTARSDRQRDQVSVGNEGTNGSPANESDLSEGVAKGLKESPATGEAEEPTAQTQEIGDTEKQKAERNAEEDAKRLANEEADRKAKDKATRKAQQEADRKAEDEAARKAKQEADRKTKEQNNLESKRAEAKQRQATRQKAHRTLATSHLVQIDNTWRLLDLERKLFQLAPVARNNIPLTTPDAVRTFMKGYSNAMLEEFQRRTITRTQQGKPVVHSEWMMFMACNHPEIDPTQFGLTRNRLQQFYDRAKEEARIFDKIRFSTEAQAADPNPEAALEVREEIQNTYELLDENTEVKTALQILGQRLGDPPIDATKLRIVDRNAPRLATNPFKVPEKNTQLSRTIPPSTPKTDTKVEIAKKSKPTKAQSAAIALLKKKGLAEGEEGWSPKEMTDILNTLEEEVANIETEGLTAEQEEEVDSVMKEYYKKRFSEWLKLDDMGQARSRALGYPPGTVTLPRPERLMHMYLRSHLIAPRGRGEAPKMRPDTVMEEEARAAALQALTQKFPKYLAQAKAQQKKKSKQIKTMEKKIRLRIRSLQKKDDVQAALETLESDFDPRFTPE